MNLTNEQENLLTTQVKAEALLEIEREQNYVPVVTKTVYKNLLNRHEEVLRKQKRFKDATSQHLAQIKSLLNKGKTDNIYEMLTKIEEVMNEQLVGNYDE